MEVLIALGIVASLLLPAILLMGGANEEVAEAAAFVELLDELARQRAREPRPGRWVACDRSGSRELVLCLPAGGDARASAGAANEGEEGR